MGKVIVLYDGWCPFCKKSIGTFRMIDWLGKLSFISFRETESNRYEISLLKLEKRMHTVKQDGKIEEGIDAINRICKQIPLLWVAVPFITLSISLGLGQRFYDFIANRRTIFPTGGCNETSCELPVRKIK